MGSVVGAGPICMRISSPWVLWLHRMQTLRVLKRLIVDDSRSQEDCRECRADGWLAEAVEGLQINARESPLLFQRGHQRDDVEDASRGVCEPRDDGGSGTPRCTQGDQTTSSGLDAKVGTMWQ